MTVLRGLVVLVMAGIVLAIPVPRRSAAGLHRKFHTRPPVTVNASYEGLVGSGTACRGVRVNTWERGTASHYRCGTRITIWYRRHKVHAISLDWGPAYWTGRSLDIWDATARGLGFASGNAFGVRVVRMSVGWR